MRIGELLRNDGVLTPWQLEAVLRMETQYGGRFASNAIELGYVEPDVAARALGRQLKVPAALEKHFDAIEPHAVARFSSRIAEKYQAIPLGYSSKQAATIIIAFVDPTQLVAIDELQFLLKMKVRASVAPEVRIARALERHYGIAAKHRRDFVRVAPSDDRGDGDDEIESSKHAYVPALSSPPPSYGRGPASTPDPSAPGSEPPMSEQRSLSSPSLPDVASSPQGRYRRSRLDTKSELAGGRPPPVAASLAPPRRPSVMPAREERASVRARDPRADPEETRTPTTPERPAVRTASSRPGPSSAATEPAAGWSMPPRMPPPPEPLVARAAISAGDAIETLSRVQARESIGLALVDYLRSSFGCAALLVTRNDIALGWKGFSLATDEPSITLDDDARAIEALALPLTKPSILAIAYETQTTFRGAPPRAGEEIHARLFAALRTPPPHEAVVAPIMVADRVVTLVYAQAHEFGLLSPGVLRDLGAVCAAASAGYLRLMHDARERPPK